MLNPIFASGNPWRHFSITAVFFSVILLLTPCFVWAAIEVDGLLNEPDWEGAQRFRDFVVVDPLSLETPRLATEALLLSMPEGLAAAFICEQPPEEIRSRTITAKRDSSRFDSDSVSLMIDFDGTGKIGYEFSVSITGAYRDGSIVDENVTNYSWDGLWQRAVNEEPERWTVEILIPWSIVAMSEAAGEIRHIGVFFQRDLQATKETFAFPATSIDLMRFVSSFAGIDVKRFSAREFNVWPYVTVLSDLVHDSITGKAGLDLFWKPSGRFQVAATFNPDFSQVESDDLVIDFSAIETSFTEKRPFFTENQGIFLRPLAKGATPIYTRRIGGARDDNGGPSDIDGALKIIGSVGSVNYGFFTAHEADEVGRSFYAGRVVFPKENWSVGLLSTYTERPFLDRTALVNGVDYDIKLNDAWRSFGEIITSQIDAKDKNSDGLGAFTVVQYTPNDQWFYQLCWFRWGNTLDISDMGYMPRNNLEHRILTTQYNQTDFAENSKTASVTWVALMWMEKNTDGVRLPSLLSFSRTQKMRSGTDISSSIRLNTQGYDDLISRGNGVVFLKKRWSSSISYSTPRHGAWRRSLTLDLFQEGYEGWGTGLTGGVTYYPHEKLNLELSLNPRWSRDWLIWLRGTQLASYSRRQVIGKIITNWFPAQGHEIRLNTQWITINADAKQSYFIGNNGRLIPNSRHVDNFAALNFGLQLRYRYEIAPLSDFYIVYSRGGLDYLYNSDKSTVSLLGKSTSIRDSDQVMIKLRYRF